MTYKNHIAYTTIDDYIQEYLNKEKKLDILDVGSQDIEGCYRDFFDYPNWKYYGLDIAPGKNVDFIVEDPYNWEVNGTSLTNTFDVIVSGQCLEHVEFPWLTAKEMYRVCKPGGFCFISVPQVFKRHDFPVDCWRFLEHGLISLMDKWAGFKTLRCETKAHTKNKILSFWAGRK